LRELLDNPDGTSAEQVMLRAADLLGKSVGLYKDVVETVVQRSPDEIRAELNEYLARLNMEADKDDKSVH